MINRLRDRSIDQEIHTNKSKVDQQIKMNKWIKGNIMGHEVRSPEQDSYKPIKI